MSLFIINMKKNTGILLINIGTPDAPTPGAVRRYLREFLSDQRVVELPRWLWLPLLNGIILPFRATRSAKLYQKIWTQEGSPLAHITSQQVQKLQASFDADGHDHVFVTAGMCYGTPSVAQGMQNLREKQVEKIVILPLYPQYSAAATGAAFDAVSRCLQGWRYIPQLHFVNEYATNPLYIEALVQQIARHRHPSKNQAILLFSFHGIPKRCVDAGDPYFDLCQKTANLVAEKLNYTPKQWRLVFQSRFGKEEWLQPYCDKTLQALPRQGVEAVDVICPGFSADCLETLEEISETNRDLFFEAGGKSFRYIPALNDSEAHVAVLRDVLKSWTF